MGWVHVWCVQSKRKIFSYLDKAKLPQGLHSSKWMRPMDYLGQHQSHASGMCTLPALPQHGSPGTSPDRTETGGGVHGTGGLGEETGKSPAPERNSAGTRLGVGSSAGDSFGGRSGSVPGSVTQPGRPGNLSGLSGPTHAAPRSQAALQHGPGPNFQHSSAQGHSSLPSRYLLAKYFCNNSQT